MVDTWAALFVEHGGPTTDLPPEELQARLHAVVTAAGLGSDAVASGAASDAASGAASDAASGAALAGADADAVAAALVVELARRAAAGEPWALGGESAQELGLACACVAGERAALTRLDERYLSVVTPALAHMQLGAAAVDEIRQDVRRKLLVPGPDGEIKLVRYAGRGRLRGLVKVVAVRTALDRLRRRRAEPDPAGDDLERLASPAENPELHFLKAHYREAFRAAFARAVQQLERRDRNILRLHLLGGMTLEEVGRMYGVHRATVVRTLARVRKQLFSATRRFLREDLKIDRDEFESVMGLIHSRLEVSLDRLLQTVTPPDEAEPSPPG